MHQISGEKLLESLFDGVYFVDVNMNITYWNSAAERITGYGKSEAVGIRCSDNLLRHIDVNGCELCLHGCPLAATMQDGKSRESDDTLETIIRRADRLMYLSKSRVRNRVTEDEDYE